MIHGCEYPKAFAHLINKVACFESICDFCREFCDMVRKIYIYPSEEVKKLNPRSKLPEPPPNNLKMNQERETLPPLFSRPGI